MSDEDQGFEPSTLDVIRRIREAKKPPPSLPPIVRKRPTHTITEKPLNDGSSLSADVEWTPRHQSGQLECGGYCCLAPNHIGLCECGGDEPGFPGSCPA